MDHLRQYWTDERLVNQSFNTDKWTRVLPASVLAPEQRLHFSLQPGRPNQPGRPRGRSSRHVLDVPFVTSQPKSQTVSIGSTAIFSVSVPGSPNLFYQWNFNGSTLLLRRVQLFKSPMFNRPMPAFTQSR